MSTLKAIVFDLDGTLVATEEIHRRVFNQAFQDFSLPFQWSVSDYARLLTISGGRERLFSFLQSQNFVPPTRQSLRDYATALHQHKSKLYREKLTVDGVQLRPGVGRLIAEARAHGLSLAIATCTSLANVKSVLKNAYGDDALSLFETITTCDLVVNKKPSPAVYQHALAHLGVTAQHCIAIEDTSNGCRAALTAGIKTVITSHPLTIDEDFTGASLVVDHIGEPDNHFKLLDGYAFGARYINVDLLQKIVAAESYESWREPMQATAS